MPFYTVAGIVIAAVGCAGSQGSDKAGGEASSSVLEQGLVAHWCFDSEAGVDCSKGGFDGYVVGSIQATDGIVGKAASFDGSSWIEIPSPFFLDGLCEVSLSVFMRMDDVGNGSQILGGGDFRGGTDPLSFQFYGGRFTNVGFEDITQDTRIKADWDDDTVRYGADQWYHFATTLAQADDGARLRIYLDGVLVEEVHEPGRRCVGYDITMPTQIGAIHGEQVWKGAIDELRIYHRTLSDEEVALLAAPLPQ